MTKPAKLWVPDEKIPERIKQMAWAMFMEKWKARINADTFNVEAVYRECLDTARKVFKIESGAATFKS